MKNYVVHDAGRIVRTFTLAGAQQLPPDEREAILAPAEATLLTHFVLDGRVVPIPKKPGAEWVFDYAAGVWGYSEEMAMRLVRADRDARLSACDWRVLPDSPTTEDARTLWLAYRQALRDVTLQPLPVVWPVPPA